MLEFIYIKIRKCYYKIEGENMNDKNKNEMIKWSTRITSLFLSTITAVTMAGCKLNKDKSNENTITTTSISVESQNDTITDNTLEDYEYTDVGLEITFNKKNFYYNYQTVNVKVTLIEKNNRFSVVSLDFNNGVSE